MRLTFMRQFYTTIKLYDGKPMVLGGITLYILPVVKFDKINNTVSVTFAWIAWGLIIELSAYYDKGNFKVKFV